MGTHETDRPTETLQSSSEDAYVRRLIDKFQNEPDVLTLDRLVAWFGYGDNVELRTLFFRRIIEGYRTNGPPFAELVYDVAKRAASRERPAHWFCAVLRRECQARGWHLD